ncbi:apolipoprotein A-IV-like isoform X2 [Hypomesus transpacificus]|uniref:apolipoprotein A-IV-like isoform X2 n=1 Tax=Hypomesus transpacificus TaxID=137520 RepID=UPI001F07FEFD|nr:apolipoprotein A-IV-like isoform X2 [Hypomesus transpacificus]XP_046896891.1 apolipoprotein A-IV-like isoform X2 [Hypomesus transpacificus]
MRVLVVLALAVFTDCHANLFYADEPKPQLEQLTDAFWDYVTKATSTADDVIQTIRKSSFGEDINSRMTNTVLLANQYGVSLHKRVSPMAKNLITQITQEVEEISQRLSRDLTRAHETLEPFIKEMNSQVQQTVEQLKQELAPYAESLDSDALRATLLQKSEELKTSLDQSVKELQSQLGPYTEELRQRVDQRLQEFQRSVAPLAENLQSQLTHRAELVQQSLAPYAEDLREKLDPYAQDLQAQLTSLYQSFSNTN